MIKNLPMLRSVCREKVQEECHSGDQLHREHEEVGAPLVEAGTAHNVLKHVIQILSGHAGH